MKIYNSLTRKKEEFVPLEDKNVKMYACGITVSADAHIGHAVQAIIFDIIRKYLEKRGYNVTYARNYTDVDDKIILSANKLGVDPIEFAKQNIVRVEKLMAELKVTPPTMNLKATENIDNIIEFISKLIEKGYAYVAPEGDVYFSVEKDKSYGKLSNRNPDDMISSVRIENEENKHSPLDFALWKSAKPNEIYWSSPWGKGRPGWHIECSAMNYYHLGEQIDIHGGGRDLIFPHHENEIAQTECLTGKPFAKYWVHNGLLKLNGQKMSKSLGNVISIQELLEKYGAEVIRFGILQTNYKNDINITDNLFPEAEKHILDFYKVLAEVEKLNINSSKLNSTIDEEFNQSMDDDFNTAKALANLFGYFKTMKLKLAQKDDSVVEDYNAIKKTYSLLGLFTEDAKSFIEKHSLVQAIPAEVLELANKRLQARKEKNFALSDVLRDQIKALGYEIKDSKEGFELNKL